MRIDLNADMGEGFGPWAMGDDSALLDIVTSANVACGFHAGDPDVMARTMKLAASNRVGIGAHPGFDDLQGFGRRRLPIAWDTLQNQIRYQIGAAQAMATAIGSQVRHIKLHGALSNMTSENKEMALACYEAALSVAPNARIMVLSATAQMDAVQELKCAWVGEIFADRAYNDDATLVDRKIDGAVIHDADLAGPRISQMVKESAIITATGKRIETQIDTVCLHGDTAGAVSLAKAIKAHLLSCNIQVQTFD